MTALCERFVCVFVLSLCFRTVAALTNQEVLNVAGVLLFVLGIVLLIVFLSFLAKECVRKMNLFKSRSDESKPYPDYDEVDEALRQRTLPPPSLPKRPAANNVKQLNAPAEYAPPRPEEPEYIIPEASSELALEPLKSSCPPKEKDVKMSTTLPEEPEYIYPEEPDNSLNPDGYLRPIM